MTVKVGPGVPEPLGATPDPSGVNFAVFSANSSAVRLCLFEPDERETAQIVLPARTGAVWHGRVEGLRPGQRYGLRVEGPYAPETGHRFNVNKLLVDPYANELSGRYVAEAAVFGFERGAPTADLSFDGRDSAPFVPRCVVTEPAPSAEWARPRRPWSETVIYEAHVRGLTRLMPGIPEPLRGTYEALGHPALIDHLLHLGITALELLPIQAIGDEPSLLGRGLTNYWGYSTLAYLAPEPRYYGPSGADGLRTAVRALHAAGIEVLLDVVYNHTAEGGEDGPTLSFRGIDNLSYYKHRPDDPRRAWDSTGCGNTLDASHPVVVALSLDSMRHWAEQYGIDGFRFDLAPTLARHPYAFDPRAPFFEAVGRDPVLCDLKLIAEPWDLGDDGYRLGGFPSGWGEWNDRFRDAIRAFWRGEFGTVPRLAESLTGSAEIFAGSGRSPTASVNFVCAHDGFTLRDLVSYEHKHNEANGEGNHDGSGSNLSDNHGHEGETDDPAILAARKRSVRNLLASTLLAQGVPMLVAGDELSRSQGGNNNAYCQDNPTSWVDWEAGRAHDPDLPDFVAHLIGLRRRYPALRRETFFQGQATDGSGRLDIYWLDPSGREMTGSDWAEPDRRAVGLHFGSDDDRAERLLLLLNASDDPMAFRLAPDLPGGPWRQVLDTGLGTGRPGSDAPSLEAAGTFLLPSRSAVLFQQHH